ncbi:MAG: putative homoserine kinase type (protein kinase fold) [Solirubrobacterales bacterium]|jgi:hypothetical protein|nr:putative homoserine kinase type (protein kinase fold) [Solirubrobacterales bacterium]
MIDPARDLPSPQELTRGLTRILGEVSGTVSVFDRRRNPYAATFASEIVTCGLGDDRALRLFCKYGPMTHPDVDIGRRGLEYEAGIYREVLEALPVETVPFYGDYRDPNNERCWLVLGHIDQAIHAHKASAQGAAMQAAARWIGEFHRLTEPLVPSGVPDWVERYDAQHYARWARRTRALAGDLRGRHPWLAPACEAYESLVKHLVARSTTVVHGDYYPDNILLSDGRLWPLDWEWAAVGVGEIDLAALTFSWPPELMASCETSYARARWGNAVPVDFETTLAAARLYLCFRYMGISQEYIRDERRRWRFQAVRDLSERLGLIEPAATSEAPG